MGLYLLLSRPTLVQVSCRSAMGDLRRRLDDVVAERVGISRAGAGVVFGGETMGVAWVAGVARADAGLHLEIDRPALLLAGEAFAQHVAAPGELVGVVGVIHAHPSRRGVLVNHGAPPRARRRCDGRSARAT